MVRTITELLQAGMVLRWWCFACADGALLSRAELRDGWFLDLAEVAVCCPKCG
jgi:hypothetical protein